MKRPLILAMLLTCCICTAFADGGRLRFSKPAGPFLVTLFTTPEPLTPGNADFSVMVQDAGSGNILSGAQIMLALTSQANPALTLHAIASHGIATNRLLQAAEINLPESGRWNLHLEVQDGVRSASIDTPIFIEHGSRQATLIWIFATLPLLAIFFFILHQRQKALLPHPSDHAIPRKL